MMIRRFQLVNFYYKSLQFHEKCRILSSALSTSTCQSKWLRNTEVTHITQAIKDTKRNYEDTFGNIENFEQMFHRINEDPEDILEYQKEKEARGQTMAEYIKEIKSYLDKRDYKSALNTLEVDMVKDKKRINKFVYALLISYNAKIGNLEEASRLFENFKKRQGIVSGGIYTSMFNACANCSNSLIAIEKANRIEEDMRRNKNYVINMSNYNAMLKAYGRHGDIPTCLKIIDEVFQKRGKINAFTYNYLLDACISDKNSGFRHALIVWRKMLQNKIKPDIYSFNALLRCIKECSLGDVVLLPEIINQIKEESGKFFKKKVKSKLINDKEIIKLKTIPVSGPNFIPGVENKVLESPEKNSNNIIELPSSKSSQLSLSESSEISQNQDILQVEMDNLGNKPANLDSGNNENNTYESIENFSNAEQNFVEKSEECENIPDISSSLKESELPNFIALYPTTGSMVKFDVMTKPQDRFMLVGGVKGFLKTMKEFQVDPNVKTFTAMLDVIPSTMESEKELMALVRSSGIKFDTIFFNMLIRRRFFRQEDHTVKDCLEEMFSLSIKPDLITFGVLALGCNTYELGMDFLKTLHNHGYRANTEILETLLRKASYARDMKYVHAILQVAKEDSTQLSPKFLAKLENLVDRERYRRKKEKEMLIEAEKSQ